jgi:hypothetical protein
MRIYGGFNWHRIRYKLVVVFAVLNLLPKQEADRQAGRQEQCRLLLNHGYVLFHTYQLNISIKNIYVNTAEG